MMLELLDKISPEENQIIIGSLLGDGSITQKGRAIFTESHSLKQETYLLWKTKKLKQLNPIINKRKKMIKIRIPFCRELNNFRELFYPQNKKILPERILQKLEVLGLAVWVGDDGCMTYTSKYKYKRLKLSTQSFSLEEHKKIVKYFQQKWKLNPRICLSKKKYHCLRFTVVETKKLIEIIKFYLPSYMHYKLGIRK